MAPFIIANFKTFLNEERLKGKADAFVKEDLSAPHSRTHVLKLAIISQIGGVKVLN